MIRFVIILIASLLLSSCTFNPFTTDNELTGSPIATGVGAAAGGGLASVFHSSQNVIAASAIGGGLIGYYVSTLRFASGGILRNCGLVYTLGNYLTIEIPTDKLFEINSADFLDDAGDILNSTLQVLKRYPNHNIFISGNTSGFGTENYQLQISEARARQVAAYLWANGISQFKAYSLQMRHLIYTGYGDFFPIANDIHNHANRKNSRIQITAFPSYAQLRMTKYMRVYGNIGGIDGGC